MDFGEVRFPLRVYRITAVRLHTVTWWGLMALS
jgi:hypothetical protein